MNDARMSRRTVLRGAGAVLALPWLESLQAALSDGSGSSPAPPRRVAALFFPNGVREDRWTPQSDGSDWQLTEQLQPLKDIKSKVSVVSGLWHQACNTGDGHYVKDAAWLTGTTITKTTGVNLNSGGTSMDQVAALHLGQHTPLPSLELGIEPVSSGVDGTVGYTRVYGAHISWRTPTQPLAKEINPRLVFERMTRIAAGRPDGRSNRPLLDLVSEDAKRLEPRISHADRHRLNQYLESVRSLEQRLERAESPGRRSWKSNVDFAKQPLPPEEPQGHAERVRLMLDMIALAFEADVTRVATFMFGNSVSNVNFAFLPDVTQAHHETSHHQNKPEKLEQYQKISTWHVAQFAYLLNKLQSTPEGEASVLDNSAILFGSALRDGNKHSPHDLPLLLAGGAGGSLKTGQHVRMPRDNPMSNLLLTILHSAGIEQSHFADSTGLIESLLA
jgi:hypothetical protein